MILLSGWINTSTAFVTVFIGVKRSSRSSFSMNAGGAKPVATGFTFASAPLFEKGEGEGEGRTNNGRAKAVDGDALLEDARSDGTDGTEDAVLRRTVKGVVREGVEGANVSPIFRQRRKRKKIPGDEEGKARALLPVATNRPRNPCASFSCVRK